MFVLISTALFILGAIVASFIGVVTGRLNTGQSFLFGRSHCDACGARLAPDQLVPVLSYLASAGRACCCGVRLSATAPLSEIVLGGLFVLAYLSLGFSQALPLLLASLSFLLALVLYDIAHQILPSSLLIVFVATSALTRFSLADSTEVFVGSLFTATLFALLLASIHFLSRGRAMGLADAPFVFGCALLAGPAALAGFIFSFWIGAFIGIIVLFLRPSGSRMGVEVPFAPYLAAGFLLAYFTQWDPFTLVAGLL